MSILARRRAMQPKKGSEDARCRHTSYYKLIIGGRVMFDTVARRVRRRAFVVGPACCALALMAVAASPAAANNSYNANSRGQLSELLTYAGDTLILFASADMPKVSNCIGSYFVIPGDQGLARQQELSRLLTAYASHENINIGYDEQTCGPNGYILVYRVG
jgi:hypothetical protein